jgi:hypothetical protein
MLQRIRPTRFVSTICNHRLLSLSARVQRQQSFTDSTVDVRNQDRPFNRLHPRSSNFKQSRSSMNKTRSIDNDMEMAQVKFNRYKTTKKVQAVTEQDGDLFAEETDHLTILGADRQAFSSSTTQSIDMSMPKVVSMSSKSETYDNSV